MHNTSFALPKRNLYVVEYVCMCVHVICYRTRAVSSSPATTLLLTCPHNSYLYVCSLSLLFITGPTSAISQPGTAISWGDRERRNCVAYDVFIVDTVFTSTVSPLFPLWGRNFINLYVIYCKKLTMLSF